jgi:hypothetical protein
MRPVSSVAYATFDSSAENESSGRPLREDGGTRRILKYSSSATGAWGALPSDTMGGAVSERTVTEGGSGAGDRGGASSPHAATTTRTRAPKAHPDLMASDCNTPQR